jgi:peptidoglycan/LPS O-acetylase OafA/YrhL
MVTQAQGKSRQRYLFLDGLRGWGSVTVVFFHVLIEGFPANATMADRDLWAKVFFLNGTFAVAVFFIVSGFSLSIGYLERRDWRILLRLGAGRYLRLVIPIFAICLIVHILLVLGIIPPADQRVELFRTALNFDPTAAHLLKFGLFDVFFAYSSSDTYVPPLWTMPLEFFGSYITLGLLTLFAGARLRIIASAGLACYFGYRDSWYALFPVGVLFADIFLCEWAHGARCRLAWVLCLPIGVALTMFPRSWHVTAYIVAASFITASFIFMPGTRAFLENRLSRFLGHISFPLYLVHAPIMWAFSLNFIPYLEERGASYAAAVAVNDALTIPLSFLAAIAFAPINEVAIVAARRFGNALLATVEQTRGRFVRT